MDKLLEQFQRAVVDHWQQVAAALLILVLGHIGAVLVRNVLDRLLGRRKVDGTIRGFLTSLTYFGIMTFVVIAAVTKLGVETTSLAAGIAAAGLTIGLALQGSLSNFAAGLLLLVLRPFKQGDYIEGAGTAGVVDSMQVFTTTLLTPDNKKVIVPNAKLTADNIINYSATGTRRVQITASVSYGDDLDKVRAVLRRILEEDPRVLREQPSQIAVNELGHSSVDFVVRAWVRTADYWDFLFETTEKIKKRFDAEGITIPFPQRDVHVYQHPV